MLVSSLWAMRAGYGVHAPMERLALGRARGGGCRRCGRGARRQRDRLLAAIYGAVPRRVDVHVVDAGHRLDEAFEEGLPRLDRVDVLHRAAHVMRVDRQLGGNPTEQKEVLPPAPP